MLHPISLPFILILSRHPRPTLPSVLYHVHFLTKILYTNVKSMHTRMFSVSFSHPDMTTLMISDEGKSYEAHNGIHFFPQSPGSLKLKYYRQRRKHIHNYDIS
jgi:hypothetical protein